MAGKRGNNEGTIVRRQDGRWMAAVTIGRDTIMGEPKRVYFYGKTRQEVAGKLVKALNDVRQGVFVKPIKLTVGQWLDTWLYEYKKLRLRPTTFDSYEVMVRCHLKPAIGHILLKDLRPEHLQRLYREKLANGLSPRTVRYIHAVINQALRQAVKNQLIACNVSEATVLPSEGKKEIRPLTTDQVAQLLTSIEGDRLYPAILLELATGLRRGELLALRWQDIDLKAGMLTVRQNLAHPDGCAGRAETP